MKIGIIDFQYKTEEYFSQEMGGGFGVKTWVGNSFLARLITRNKKRMKFPIIMLAYVAAIFRDNGHEVVVLNNEDEISDADLFILHSSIVNFKKEIQLCQLIKERTHGKIGIIGPFCSAKPEIYKPYLDFIIKGEPEIVVGNVDSIKDIPRGIVESSPVEDIDELPFPAWEYFDTDKYTFEPVLKKKPFLELSGSRGCSATCNYCPYRAYYGSYRGRSINSVIKEIVYLIKNFGIRSLLFRDSNFTFRKEWSLQLAHKMINHGFDIEWACETRLDLMDEDMLKLFKESGLRHIGVGVENYNEEILRKSSRLPIKKEHCEKIISYCQKIDISILANYIFGFPGDSKENILNTIKYAKKLNTPFAAFNICTPYPDTIFYEKNKDRICENDFEKFTGSNPVMEIPGLSREEMLRLSEKAYVSYYFRLAWLLKNTWKYRS